ncbi:MAG: hypothetical protein V4672_18795 [Verrucomicrobiota bacterium]
MPAILDPQTEKRTKIRQWEATAIGLQEAEARQLIRYSSITHWRNWTCREALYDFAQQSAQATPTLVRIDEKRLALYTSRRPR